MYSLTKDPNCNLNLFKRKLLNLFFILDYIHAHTHYLKIMGVISQKCVPQKKFTPIFIL